MKTILSVLCLAFVGCCPTPPTRLEIIGEPPPCITPVLLVAQEHCSSKIVGTLTFTEKSLDGKHGGYCNWDLCGMTAWVERIYYGVPSKPWPAPYTLTAHEIGHYCLRSENETEVEAWALEVNREARIICEGPP